jgi:hypothetical protein
LRKGAYLFAGFGIEHVNGKKPSSALEEGVQLFVMALVHVC